MAKKRQKVTTADVVSTAAASNEYLVALTECAKRLLSQAIARLEREILRLVDTLISEEGRLVSTRTALKQAQKVHARLTTLFEQEYGEAYKSVVAEMAGGVKDLVAESYRSLGAAAKFTDVDREMIKALQRSAWAQFEMYGNQAQERIAKAMYEQMFSRASYTELENIVRGIVRGHEDARGVPMEAHARQISTDAIMNFHSELTITKGEDAGLSTFLYYGDIILTSREFCIERAGYTFDRETIESWNDLDWKGKAGPPLIYRGGYNCRHSWILIEDEWMAGESRAEIQDAFAERGLAYPHEREK